MYYKTCEICGKRAGRVSGQKRSFMATFPLDEDRCKRWVQVTGNEDLVYVPIEKLHQLKQICGKHFRLRDFKKKKTQLKKNAIPSLFLTAKPLPDEILMEFPLHIFGITEPSKSTAVTATVGMGTSTSERNTPCNSRLTLAPLIYNPEMDHDYCRPYVVTPGLTLAPLIYNPEMDHDYCRPYVVTPEPTTSNEKSENGNINKRKRPCSPNPSTLTIEAENSNISKRIRPCSPKPSKLTVKTKISNNPKRKKLTVEAENSNNSRRKKPSNPKSSTETVSMNLMSPRKIKLMKKLKKSKYEIKDLNKKISQIEKVTSTLPVLKSILQSSVKNQNRKPNGQRWTKLNKSVALAIYKKSPKAYRYLSQLLPMPSVRTLQTVLENMKMTPGIDISVMEHLKKKAETLTDQNKICVLLFDEIALKKRLIYNSATDEVDGFEDLGGQGGRSEKNANHALVLMLQGIHKKIKQPIAYYFVKGTISTEKLVIIIKTAIRAVTEAGYKVLATVCDQGPTNVGAMNFLKKCSGEPADSNNFLLDDEKVFIIYDVPHLFKSLRNNFLQGGILKMNNKTAKWSHLIELEEKNQSTLHFTKITKAHVSPKYRAKMKVKLAAQILSNTVAAILKLLAESAENNEKNKEILETAHIVEDLDRLFDCTNGPSSHKDIKKEIRQNVTKNSYHHKCWIEYKKKLKTLHFLKSNSQLMLKNVRCVNGYITSISSLQDIWKYVESKNFKYLNLRQCNQDALENLFGIIRQHSPTNRNPTCHHFTAALKSSILTRLSTPISRGSNCEKDENEILFDFHDIVFAKNDDLKEKCKYTSIDLSSNDHLQNLNEDISYVLHIPEEQIFEHEMEEMEEMFKGFDKQPTVYVSGYLAKVLLKDVTCKNCINSMKVSFPKPNSIYNYIAFKEWWKDKTSLTYPTLQLCETIDTATKIFELEVATRMYVRDVCKYAITVMICGTNLSWMCRDHQATMTDKLLRRLSLLLIRNECRTKNRSFAELEDPLADTVKKGQQQGILK